MLLKKYSSYILITLFILLVYFLMLRVYSRNFGHDLSGFACVGDRFHVPGTPEGEWVRLRNSPGYDGQFFLYMCHDPLLTRGLYRFLDAPAYRYQRILYPAMTFLFSCGKESLFPLMLLLVNLGALILGTFGILVMLKEANMNPWHSLFYPFLSGLFLCVLRDLAEPLGMLFFIFAILFYLKKKVWFFGGALSLMLLTREILVLILPFFLLDALVIKKDLKRASAVLFSGLPWLAWEFYVSLRTGVIPFFGGERNFSTPFSGLLSFSQKLFSLPSFNPYEKPYFLITVLILLSCLVLAFSEIRKRRDALTLAFLFYSLFPFLLSDKVWVEPWSYGRVLLPVYLLCIVNFIASGARAYYFPLFGQACLFLVTLGYVDLW